MDGMTNTKLVHRPHYSSKMISIHRTEVPHYLHASEFYKALVDDDEPIMIPKECFAKNDLVNCPEDLALLLSTLRFWGVSEIPHTVVKYTVWNKPTSVINAFAQVQNELRYVQFLEALCVKAADAFSEGDIAGQYYYGHRTRTWSTCRMKCAAEICVVQYESENGKTWDATTCMLAAQFGLLDALTFLHEHGCPWDKRCCEKAAGAGSLECLQYAHENGCPWDSNVCVAAAKKDSLQCLQYAHEHGCELDDQAYAAAQSGSACMEYLQENACSQGKASCARAAERGDLALLKELHRRGCEWDKETCYKAAVNGRLDILSFAHENGCPWDAKLCFWAVLGRSLPCLKYAHEHGCPWDSSTLEYARTEDVFSYAFLHNCPGKERACEYAANSANIERLVFARENGCPLTATTCSKAVFLGSLSCLTYAHKQGCPWDVQTCNKAARWDSLDCLRYAHENGCPWDATTCASAAEGGKTRCLRYAHEHGCPWDAATCTAAAASGGLECLQYAHENGCVWDLNAVFAAIREGKLSCLTYLFENGCPWPPVGLLQCVLQMSARNRKCLEYAAEHPDSPSSALYTFTFTADKTDLGFNLHIKTTFHAPKPLPMAEDATASVVKPGEEATPVDVPREPACEANHECGRSGDAAEESAAGRMDGSGDDAGWSVVGKRGRVIRTHRAPPSAALAPLTSQLPPSTVGLLGTNSSERGVDAGAIGAAASGQVGALDVGVHASDVVQRTDTDAGAVVPEADPDDSTHKPAVLLEAQHAPHSDRTGDWTVVVGKGNKHRPSRDVKVATLPAPVAVPRHRLNSRKRTVGDIRLLPVHTRAKRHNK